MNVSFFALHGARNSAASHLANEFPSSKVLNQLFAIMFATEYSSEAPVSSTLQSNANTHTEQGVAPLGRAPLCFSGDLKERVTTTVTAQCQGEQSGFQMIT